MLEVEAAGAPIPVPVEEPVPAEEPEPVVEGLGPVLVLGAGAVVPGVPDVVVTTMGDEAEVLETLGAVEEVVPASPELEGPDGLELEDGFWPTQSVLAVENVGHQYVEMTAALLSTYYRRWG